MAKNKSKKLSLPKKHNNPGPSHQANKVTIKEEHSVSVAISGPIPPPSVLQSYNEILPGAADRILTMAETQSLHRQKIESKVINTDALNSTLGLFFGLVIGLVGLIGAFYLILNDHEIIGGIFGGGTLISLVSTFVYGSRQKRAERESRSVQLSDPEKTP